MINKLIKGGLKKTNKITYENNHKLDNENEITYATIDVVTNDIVDNNQKKFTLYKFFNVITYNNELFNLPEYIKNNIKKNIKNNIKNIYLFGFHNGFVDKNFFVKKNKGVIGENNALSDYTEKIGASLKNLYKYKEINKYLEIILVHYKDENNSGLYIIFNTTSLVDKYYNELEKSFASKFIDDDNLKKQLNFSNLKNLIKFTNENLPHPTPTTTTTTPAPTTTTTTPAPTTTTTTNLNNLTNENLTPPTPTTNLKTQFLLSLLSRAYEKETQNIKTTPKHQSKNKTEFLLNLLSRVNEKETQNINTKPKHQSKNKTEFLLNLLSRVNEKIDV